MDLVCLQETKIQEMDKALVCSLGVGRFLDSKALNVERTMGGILLLWDRRRISLVDLVIGSFLVSCLFRMVEDGYLWAFSRVYSLVERSHKEFFWEELGLIRGPWEGPWCLGGDFNEILSPNKRSRGGRLSPAMRRFSEIMNDLGLRDLPL